MAKVLEVFDDVYRFRIFSRIFVKALSKKSGRDKLDFFLILKSGYGCRGC